MKIDQTDRFILWSFVMGINFGAWQHSISGGLFMVVATIVFFNAVYSVIEAIKGKQ